MQKSLFSAKFFIVVCFGILTAACREVVVPSDKLIEKMVNDITSKLELHLAESVGPKKGILEYGKTEVSYFCALWVCTLSGIRKERIVLRWSEFEDEAMKYRSKRLSEDSVIDITDDRANGFAIIDCDKGLHISISPKITATQLIPRLSKKSNDFSGSLDVTVQKVINKNGKTLLRDKNICA